MGKITYRPPKAGKKEPKQPAKKEAVPPRRERKGKGVGSKVKLLFEGRKKEYTIIAVEKTGFYCKDAEGWMRYCSWSGDKKAKEKTPEEKK